MHEIVTLQLGNRANYLATHFWNTQESYFEYDAASDPSPIDHDVHFRAGQGPKGEDTFTPRTLIYDLKGGFGGLRKWGGLYDQGDIDSSVNSLWDGSVVKQHDAPVTPSAYQKALDEGLVNPPKPNAQTVRYWSDFARVFYHPRSIVQINDYELGSTIVPFERWDSGEELYSKLDKDHDLLDRDIRPWAEECDQMQAIQIFGSADDAWGGFSSKYIESLRDEYGKIPLWFWGLEEQASQGQRAKQLLRTVNTAQSLQAISTLASMYVPLAVPSYVPPYLRLDRSSQWYISGVLSMALESMTLPSRQKPSGVRGGSLSDMEAALNANGNQKIAELQCSVVDPANNDLGSAGDRHATNDDRVHGSNMHDLVYEDQMEKAKEKLDMNFSAGEPSQTPLSLRQWEKSNHVFGKVGCVRGVPEAAHRMDDENEADSRKRRRRACFPTVDMYRNPLPYPLLDSFPEILVQAASSGPSAAVHTSLSTTTQLCKRTKGLQNMVLRTVDVSEREALSNGLGEIAEAYEEGWDGGSDQDSD